MHLQCAVLRRISFKSPGAVHFSAVSDNHPHDVDKMTSWAPPTVQQLQELRECSFLSLAINNNFHWFVGRWCSQTFWMAKTRILRMIINDDHWDCVHTESSKNVFFLIPELYLNDIFDASQIESTCQVTTEGKIVRRFCSFHSEQKHSPYVCLFHLIVLH